MLLLCFFFKPSEPLEQVLNKCFIKYLGFVFTNIVKSFFFAPCKCACLNGSTLMVNDAFVHIVDIVISVIQIYCSKLYSIT